MSDAATVSAYLTGRATPEELTSDNLVGVYTSFIRGNSENNFYVPLLDEILRRLDERDALRNALKDCVAQIKYGSFNDQSASADMATKILEH